MMRREFFSGGKWLGASDGGVIESRDPATGEVIATVPAATEADVDAAVNAARAAFDTGDWPALPLAERAGLLLKLASLIERDAGELAQIESLDNGKPAHIAALVDIPAAAGWFRQAAAWATTLSGRLLTPVSMPNPGLGTLAYTVREPVGVIGQIIPWNYPLLFCAWKLGPALAFGNTVVLKPAEQTPLSALKLAELIEEAGFPSGVVNVLTGVGEVAGAALCRHPLVDKLAFTGSTEVGKIVARTGVETMKRVSLELGGKSPSIVFDDADLDLAIPGVADAIFYNQGEVCGAGSRLFVQRGIYDRVVDGLAELARGLVVGPGTDAATEVGPLISAEHLGRVAAYVRGGVAEGARVVAGGGSIDRPGYFMAPTVLADCHGDMTISREEIFGPVVAVTPFDDEDDVVARANDTMYGLAAGVWTRDMGRAHRVARRVRAGTVWVNCYHVYDPVLPFGGFKQSGWGREHGEEAANLYTESKTVVVAL